MRATHAFKYQGVDPQGENVLGVEFAEDPHELAAKLWEQELFLVTCTEVQMDTFLEGVPETTETPSDHRRRLAALFPQSRGVRILLTTVAYALIVGSVLQWHRPSAKVVQLHQTINDVLIARTRGAVEALLTERLEIGPRTNTTLYALPHHQVMEIQYDRHGGNDNPDNRIIGMPTIRDVKSMKSKP